MPIFVLSVYLNIITVMKNALNYTRKNDGKTFSKVFKTKKDMQRFMNNNYTTYTFAQSTDYAN